MPSRTEYIITVKEDGGTKLEKRFRLDPSAQNGDAHRIKLQTNLVLKQLGEDFYGKES